ncbi:MAG TPA: cell division FtsA domain-containing protein [Clostridia bacterium]|nr:cell division FtsA domain-containing protein [Clostridia bacterium]
MSQFTAILDIGSSKMICLICSPNGKGGVLVHGAGVCEYKGYKHGVFADEKNAINAIERAIEAAESECKRTVRHISVGVPAPFVQIVLKDAEVVPHRRSGFSQVDVDTLIDESLKFDFPVGYELMHSTPVLYETSGTVRLDAPIGINADSVRATVSHAFVDSRFKTLVADTLRAAAIQTDMFVAVPLAEAIFITPEEDRQAVTVLLDIGGTHTDVSVVKNGALIDFRSIRMGGANFASDIAYGLRLSVPVAENIKRRYVYSLDYQDSIDIVKMPGGGMLRVDHEAIQYIVEARSRELAEYISAALDEMHVLESFKPPIYLTGGGVALMRGSADYFERCMGIPIEVRMPWMPRLSSPNYASAFAVMDFVIHASGDEGQSRLEGAAERSGLVGILRDFFEK